MKTATIFTKCEYDKSKKIYNSEAVMLADDGEPSFIGKIGICKDRETDWEIFGEIEIAAKAIEMAVKEGFASIVLDHQNREVGLWPDGFMQTQMGNIRDYAMFVNEMRKHMGITFRWSGKPVKRKSRLINGLVELPLPATV